MEESFLLFNKEVFECYSCINPYFSTSSLNMQDLHFEKGCEKPSPDRILYFYYRTREGKELYLFYRQNHGFSLYHSLSDMYRCIKNHEYFHDEFPCLKWKHYRIAKEYIDHPDGENIIHYQNWLKCAHIESNYHYKTGKTPLITFQEKTKTEEETPQKQIIDSFQYLFVTPTFYSIFYYEYGKYKIYNAPLSTFESSSI
jgi:hypothetical protein